MDYQRRRSTAMPGISGALRAVLSSSFGTVLVSSTAILLAAALFFFVIWYLAYGFTRTPPSTLEIDGAHPSEIAWHENGSVSIEAQTLSGAFTALGYAHANNHAWQMTLWRQTALGALTTWFDREMLGMDRFMQRLRIAELSRQTYAKMPDRQRHWLEAYARGVNAAFGEKKSVAQNEFALLEITPDPWEPWHALALERLFAWLSTDLTQHADSAGAMLRYEWAQFAGDDEALHSWLQLHSFDYSLAGIWHADSLAGRTQLHRFVYGSSALPLFQEATLHTPDLPRLHLATLPGTLLVPSGQSLSTSWFVLPASPTSLSLRPDTVETDLSYVRLTDRNGSEVLITLETDPDGLALGVFSDSLGDSSVLLSWPGLQTGTDIDAFVALMGGAPAPAFSLLRGDGLVARDTTWALLGAPPYTHEIADGVLLSLSPWSRYIAQRIHMLNDDGQDASPSSWPQDCHSPWAESLATFLLEDYLLQTDFVNQLEHEDALTYLRNWDFSFNSSSIGATIFQSWLRALPDTLYEKTLRRNVQVTDSLPSFLLEEALTDLRTQYGDDLSTWRLEVTQPILRRYPAWTLSSSRALTSASETLFSPLQFPGKGHVTTLCWGSFEPYGGREVSSRWEAWSTLDRRAYTYRWRKHEKPSSPLGRYLIANRPSTSYTYSPPDRVSRHTSISPSTP